MGLGGEYQYVSARDGEKYNINIGEWHSLGRLARIFRENVEALRGGVEDLKALAAIHDYRFIGVPEGHVFWDKEGKQVVGGDNKARIGLGGKLYVVVDRDGEVVDVEGLRHDVGACLLGGKNPVGDEVPFIKLETLQKLAAHSSNAKIDDDELRKRGWVKRIKGIDYVPDTRVMDGLVDRTIPYKALESVGYEWERGKRKR